MNKPSTFKVFPYLLSASLLLSIASCKKDDVANETVAKPQLTEMPANGGRDSITLGKTLVFHPKINTKTNVAFNWYVNGTATSTDSVLTFNPIAKGDYQIVFKANNASGTTSSSYNIHVWDKYENGFFIVNEGWFGHGTGNVNFFRYDTQKLEDSIYTRENPGKTLEPVSSTLENGTIFNNKLYLASKAGGPLVVTDAYTLKETGRIASLGGNDWRGFAGIDDTKGLLSSGKGLFPLDLQTLTVGNKIANVNGQLGDIIQAGKYVFVLSQTEGVVILNIADYTVAKKIAGLTVAFARTPDGAIWAAGGKLLTRIDAATLEVQNITVPFNVNSSWAAWHPGSITASTKENTIFLAKNGTFSGATTVYKYNGTAESLQNAFITLPTGKELYGAGVAYNAQTNQVVLTTVKSGFGTNYSINNLYFYDATTGSLKNDVAYTGYYFPAVIVFH